MDIFKTRTLSMMLTYQCNAECDNCGTLSSPRRREHLSLDIARKKLQEAADLKFSMVVFTGGEVTLRWRELLHLIKYSTQLNLFSRVVTNGHWARNELVAKEKVNRLIESGLKELNLSTGDEHTKFVPLENVINAAIASAQAGMVTVIMVEVRSGNKIIGSTIRQHKKIMALDKELCAKIAVVESPWMPLDPEETYDYPLGISANEINTILQSGCDSVLSTYTVQANSIIGACCGIGMQTIPELNVGTVDNNLEYIINQSEMDLIKRAIKFIGPFKLLKWANSKDESIIWENKYAHHCQPCKKIYTDPTVRKTILKNLPELKQMVNTVMGESNTIITQWIVDPNKKIPA